MTQNYSLEGPVTLGPEDWELAAQIVDSDPMIRTFAACEWDELHDDGKEWIAKIIKIARSSFSQPEKGASASCYHARGPLAPIDARRALRHLPSPVGFDSADDYFRATCGSFARMIPVDFPGRDKRTSHELAGENFNQFLTSPRPFSAYLAERHDQGGTI